MCGRDFDCYHFLLPRSTLTPPNEGGVELRGHNLTLRLWPNDCRCQVDHVDDSLLENLSLVGISSCHLEYLECLFVWWQLDIVICERFCNTVSPSPSVSLTNLPFRPFFRPSDPDTVTNPFWKLQDSNWQFNVELLWSNFCICLKMNLYVM